MTNQRLRCGATTATGGHCGAYASRATGRCSRHDPTRLGENLTGRMLRVAGDDPLAWKRLIGQAAVDVATGALSPRAGAAIASLCRAWLQAWDRHSMEREIERLRSVASEIDARDRRSGGPLTVEDVRMEG